MTVGTESESDRLARSAFDFALCDVLSFLDHGEIRSRCALVSRGWSEAASELSRCESRLGTDMGFVFELLGLVGEESFGLESEPGEFELRDLGDTHVFEPHLRIQRLWRSEDMNSQFTAVVELDHTMEGLGVNLADLVEGQDLANTLGLKLNQRLRGTGEYSENDEDEAEASNSTNVLATVLGVSQSDSGPIRCTVEISFCLSEEELWALTDELWEYDVTVVGKKHEKLWELHQEQPAREGVLKADGDVPAHVSAALRDGIASLAARPHRDYHPGSNNIVRDHVHPGLFPFVKGESEFSPSADLLTPEPQCLKKWPVPHTKPSRDQEHFGEDAGSEDEEDSKAISKDRWGRPYEGSLYQWLPTYFDVSSNGQVTIRGEINNLRPRELHRELYGALEGLFQAFLPDLAAVITYADSMRFINEDEDDDEDEVTRDESLKLAHLLVKDDLRGRSLQVITKIVDYELEPGQTHEGVWHVEGMSHEHIVATCLYVVDRDDWITGGDLLFKRAFTQAERNTIFWNVGQERDRASEKMFTDGLVPLGRLPTAAGCRLCWPNSHIHKVSTMRNEGDRPGKRCIVAFFVVDPCVRIVSTQEVSDQTEIMGLEKALSHRLNLMEERKRHKQDWNIRDLSLCEH